MSRRGSSTDWEARWSAIRTGLIVLFGSVAVGALWVLAYQHTYAEPPSSGVRYTPPPSKAPDYTELGGGASLADVRSTIASDEPLTISVLGDSTGNEDSEWVYLWADHLAESRAVTYHAWDDTAGRYLPPVELSTDGPATAIWNGSAPGRAADYPATRLGKMQPEKPDLVIYNFGHNNSADNLSGALGNTLAAVEGRWGTAPPSVAILQNPQIGATKVTHAATVRELRDVIAPQFGLPTLDVWAAFQRADEPLNVLVSNVDGLGVHPGTEGRQIWATAVADGLG